MGRLVLLLACHGNDENNRDNGDDREGAAVSFAAASRTTAAVTTLQWAIIYKARMVADCVLGMEACFGLASVFGWSKISIPIPISRVYPILHAWPLVLSDFGPAHKLVGKLKQDPSVHDNRSRRKKQDCFFWGGGFLNGLQ
jgi:hypothetical protein